jgi:hypothetical protein
VIHVEGVDVWTPMIRSSGADYRRWWDIQREAKPFQAKLKSGTAGEWPLSKTGENGRPVLESVGPYCHVEFESEQIEIWGFERRADRDRFVGLYGGTLL